MKHSIRIAAGSYALFAGLILAGMGFITRQAINAERAEHEARLRADLEENVRLALWRMDSEVAALLARENSRPYFDYAPFIGTSQRFSNMTYWRYLPGRLPSPLLLGNPRYTLLHFQVDPDGSLSSPQVPSEPGTSLEGFGLSKDDLQTAEARLKDLSALLSSPKNRLAVTGKKEAEESLIDALRRVAQAERKQSVGPVVKRPKAKGKEKHQESKKKDSIFSSRSRNEYSVRARQVEQTAQMNVQVRKKLELDVQPARKLVNSEAQADLATLRPIWVEDALFLVRDVSVGSRKLTQGVWLAWGDLVSDLTARVRDLLPSCTLRKTVEAEKAEKARLLASLPAELLAEEPSSFGRHSVSAALGLTLTLGWTAVIVALVALAGLLAGFIALSERRATFVSAVTHELRTPLTTFRMYTEMMSEGMVSEEKRDKYLATLRREAVRLSHLVENVLAYAKVDQGGAPIKREVILVADFIGRVVPRLEERAAGSDLSFETQIPDKVLEARIEMDPTAIEQILFNLTDNACKYGASELGLRLAAQAEERQIGFTIRDFGPGIDPSERSRLFRPFTKSAHQAASTAPGVGLGLALSLRLAEAHGGRLLLEASSGPGAAFTVWLPKSG